MGKDYNKFRNENDWELNSYSSEADKKRIMSQFKISCSECGSDDVYVNVFNDIRNGSEQTGMWGDAGVLLKCNKCGNAIKIISVDY